MSRGPIRLRRFYWNLSSKRSTRVFREVIGSWPPRYAFRSPARTGYIHLGQRPLTRSHSRCRRIDCTAGLLVLPLRWPQPFPSVWSRGGRCSSANVQRFVPSILDDPVVQEACVAIPHEALRSKPPESRPSCPDHVPVTLAERSRMWRRVLAAAAGGSAKRPKKRTPLTHAVCGFTLPSTLSPNSHPAEGPHESTRQHLASDHSGEG